MINNSKNINSNEDKLYNKVLDLSRNKLFYTKLDLKDTFENRINLIFLHISFLFIKIKEGNEKSLYKKFYQNMFDVIFNKIELNMRELGYGDMAVNKSMKFLVKIFYSILLDCEIYKNKNENDKNLFLLKHLTLNSNKKVINNYDLVNYFDKYQDFCLDLDPDKVLKGNLNFNY
tara:strand:- start:4450 stop:4971 length:522 start_codon:yes stop_codon:yes gene_type:complete